MWKDHFLSFAETVNFLPNVASAIIKDNAPCCLKCKALYSPFAKYQSKHAGLPGSWERSWNSSRLALSKLVVKLCAPGMKTWPFVLCAGSPPRRSLDECKWGNEKEDRITCFLESCSLISHFLTSPLLHRCHLCFSGSLLSVPMYALHIFPVVIYYLGFNKACLRVRDAKSATSYRGQAVVIHTFNSSNHTN